VSRGSSLRSSQLELSDPMQIDTLTRQIEDSGRPKQYAR